MRVDDKRYIEAARIAERITGEMKNLDPELKKILFSKILDSELHKYESKESEKPEKLSQIKISKMSDVPSQDMSLQQWCMWLLIQEFERGIEWVSAEEVFKTLRERHRIPANIISVSARLGELTRKGLVMRERKGKAFKYGISRKGKEYMSQLKLPKS